MTQGLSHAGIEAIVAADYEGYIITLTKLSGVALSIYSTLIRIDDEIEYFWLKPFTFPTLLYLLGRYSTIITQVFSFMVGTYYDTLTTRSICSNLSANIANITTCLSYVGYTGLIVARTYSLCRNKLFIVPLMLSFGVGLFFLVFGSIVFRGCIFVESFSVVCFFLKRYMQEISPARYDLEEEMLISLLLNLTALVTDSLVFGISLYKVWDTWYLKRKTGIQMGDDLASTLLKQTVSRFLFAILLNLSFAIAEWQLKDTGALVEGLGASVQALGPVLVTNYMLDLRRHNSNAIRANYASLPPIRSIQDAVQHIQQSIRVEMADGEDGDGDANLILPMVQNLNTTTNGVVFN